MKSVMIKVGALALLGLCMSPLAWSQVGVDTTAPADAKPGTAAAAPAAPKVSKEELAAYNKFVAGAKTMDDRQKVTQGEDFLAKYPNSMYAGAVDAQLSFSYMNLSQVDKMLAAGEKALAADPNNVDVLPIMAFAIARKNGSTAQQLEAAMNYARRTINLLSTMPKPAEFDDATFAKIKNQKLAQSHSAMGTAYFKTGHNDEAVTELSQTVKLDPEPDPVDYYLLGLANDRSSHFTDAVAAFDKCASLPGQLATNCKNLSAETKKKAANSLEAPK